MDRFYTMQSNQHNYIADVLNSKQQQREEQTEQVITYPLGGRGVTAQRKKNINTMNRKPLPAFVKSSSKKTSMDHSTMNAAGKYVSSRRRIGRASSESYIPPSPLCSSGASSSTEEVGHHSTNSTIMNAKKYIPTPPRRGIGRASSDSYIPPSSLCTNTSRSTKELSIDHSTTNSENIFPAPIRQGIGRACSDSYIHPSRALDDGIDAPMVPGRRSSTGNTAAAPTTPPTVTRRRSKTRMMAFSAMTDSIAAAPPTELKPSVSSSSVISTASWTSSSSSSAHVTGNNIHNSLTGTGIHVAKSTSMEEDMMMDDCSVATTAETSTAATITCENGNDYEISLSSSHQNISCSLRRILSSMSSESLLIMEETDDEDEEDDMMIRDISFPSSPNNEVGEDALIPKNSDNKVPLVVTDEKKERKITTFPPQSRYYDSDDSEGTIATTNSSNSMTNNNSSWRGNRGRFRFRFRSSLHRQRDGSFRRHSTD